MSAPALTYAIGRVLDDHDLLVGLPALRWKLIHDLRAAMLGTLARPDGIGELHAALDAHVRRALAAGEPLPPEVRAYVEAAASEGATP